MPLTSIQRRAFARLGLGQAIESLFLAARLALPAAIRGVRTGELASRLHQG